jgi:hypothetical protein
MNVKLQEPRQVMDFLPLNNSNIFQQNLVRAMSREGKRIVPREVCRWNGLENIQVKNMSTCTNLKYIKSVTLQAFLL